MENGQDCQQQSTVQGTVQIPQTIEAPLLRVPFESVKRTAKDRKNLMDKLVAIHKAVVDLKDGNKEELLQKLHMYSNQLKQLGQKFEGCSQTEADDCSRLEARVEHLNSIFSSPQSSVIEWNTARLNRLILDYLLRQGFVKSASEMADKYQLRDLVESHIFQGAQRVIQSLKNHDCGPALEWCAQNRGKLKKIKSVLEFKLHLQVYLELVRSQRTIDAIMYARKHMASWATSQTKDLQRALATAIFTSDSQYPPYQELFKDERWEQLVELFCQELYKLNNMTGESLLAIHLQAGLTALKNYASDSPDNQSNDDPFHLRLFRELAKDLPMAKHDKSKLLCSLTKTVMNEHNPPQVLPNGYVYSKLGIQQIQQENDGKIICPVTKQVYEDHDLRQAYIL